MHAISIPLFKHSSAAFIIASKNNSSIAQSTLFTDTFYPQVQSPLHWWCILYLSTLQSVKWSAFGVRSRKIIFLVHSCTCPNPSGRPIKFWKIWLPTLIMCVQENRVQEKLPRTTLMRYGYTLLRRWLWSKWFHKFPFLFETDATDFKLKLHCISALSCIWITHVYVYFTNAINIK